MVGHSVSSATQVKSTWRTFKLVDSRKSNKSTVATSSAVRKTAKSKNRTSTPSSMRNHSLTDVSEKKWKMLRNGLKAKWHNLGRIEHLRNLWLIHIGYLYLLFNVNWMIRWINMNLDLIENISYWLSELEEYLSFGISTEIVL